jgi:hypothetical protein
MVNWVKGGSGGVVEQSRTREIHHEARIPENSREFPRIGENWRDGFLGKSRLDLAKSRWHLARGLQEFVRAGTDRKYGRNGMYGERSERR